MDRDMQKSVQKLFELLSHRHLDQNFTYYSLMADTALFEINAAMRSLIMVRESITPFGHHLQRHVCLDGDKSRHKFARLFRRSVNRPVSGWKGEGRETRGGNETSWPVCSTDYSASSSPRWRRFTIHDECVKDVASSMTGFVAFSSSSSSGAAGRARDQR